MGRCKIRQKTPNAIFTNRSTQLTLLHYLRRTRKNSYFMLQNLAIYYIAIAAIVIARTIFVFCLIWKWKQMCQSYLHYRECFFPPDLVQTRREQIKKITFRWLSASNLIDWTYDAEELWDSKQNPTLWFEIVDHWYQNKK